MVRMRFAFAACLSVAMAAIRDGPAAILDHAIYAIDRCTDAISRFFVSAWKLLAPEPMAFNTEGWADFDQGGRPLDPALLNGLRHEAGMPRMSAARGT